MKRILKNIIITGIALATGASFSSALADANVGGIEKDDTGVVSGTVYFDGEQKKRRPVDVSADKYCESQHADSPVLSESYVFGESADGKGTLVNVLVYVSKGIEDGAYEAPGDKKLLNQVGCVYTPHVSGVMVGQTLTVKNSDATLHNVNRQSKENGSDNFGQPAKNMTKDMVFKNAEMGMQFKCDVHPWMKAYVHVMPHPFYAVTMKDGTYTLKGLEPGKYTISVKQQFKFFKPVEREIEVEVKAGETATADFTYEPPKKKK